MTDYETFTVDQIKDGDLLKVKGENEHGEEETWYAEKIGVSTEGEIEVYFMSPTGENDEWEYDKDYSLIPIESVMEHVPNNMGYKIAWKKLGFIKISTTRIMKIEDYNNQTVEIGSDDSDSDLSSEGSELESDLGGFIVPDDECEPFSLAQQNEWVDETHRSVRAFNNWNPSTRMEEQVKSYIENLSNRVSTEEDNRAFVNGNTIDYNNPPH